MAFIQLSLDVLGHVDPIDGKSIDPARQLHVLEPCIGDRYFSEVNAAEFSTAEVSLDETGVAIVLHEACLIHHDLECNRVPEKRPQRIAPIRDGHPGSLRGAAVAAIVTIGLWYHRLFGDASMPWTIPCL